MSLPRAIAGLSTVLWSAPSLAQPTEFESLDVSGLVLSLAIVVALIVVCAWLLRRLPLGMKAGGTGPLKLVATLPLGPRERLMLVTSRGREVLIGVSPAGVAITPVEAGSHADFGSAMEAGSHLAGASQKSSGAEYPAPQINQAAGS